MIQHDHIRFKIVYVDELKQRITSE